MALYCILAGIDGNLEALRSVLAAFDARGVKKLACVGNVVGYNADLVATAWMGFDDFGSMGHIEFGAQTALPIWIDFMRTALDGVPEKPFDMPSGISTAQIDPATGFLAPPGSEHTMSEVFRTEDLTRLANSPNQPTEAEKKVQQEAYGIF